MSTQPPPHERVASKLAQLVGDTILHHAPHTAKVNADETRRQVTEWLDGWEAHTAQFVAPFLQHVLDNTNPPEPVRALLTEAISPTAAFSSTLEQIFLWGIISSIINAAVEPFLVGISNDLNIAAVAAGIRRPVDLGTIATASGRGLNLGDDPTVTVEQWAYDQAAMLGIGVAEVNLAASIIGLPPAMQELFEMYRRGIIQEDDVRRGLREGDFRDDWIDNAIGLLHAWLTPLDFVRAAIQAQLPYDQARDWAGKTGLDITTPVDIAVGDTEATPDMFGLAFSIGGRPPGAQELAHMAHRGIIDWQGTGSGETTFQQGIAESDIKTKWTAALQAFSTYVPPPRTVGTLLEHGAITEAQARAFWEDGGVTPELAAGYVYMTEQQHVGQDKLLAKGDITTAYYDQLITNAQATEMLGLLGYRDAVAVQILAVVDFRREIKAVDSVVTKIGTLYQAFKISATNATTALIDVGISADQASNLLGTWALLRVAPVRVPSATDIAKAVKYGTLTQDQALEALAELGYQPRDAAIVLSANAEVAVTPLPPAGTTTTG